MGKYCQKFLFVPLHTPFSTKINDIVEITLTKFFNKNELFFFMILINNNVVVIKLNVKSLLVFLSKFSENKNFVHQIGEDLTFVFLDFYNF